MPHACACAVGILRQASQGSQTFKRLLAGALPLLSNVRCAGSPAFFSTHLKKLHLPSGGGPAARAQV